MKQSTRQRYEDGLKQLTLSRTIEKRSWLEHMKRAKELNQVLWGSGDTHLQQANQIAHDLRPVGERMKELQKLLWQEIRNTFMGP